MDYLCEAASIEGFMQQLCCNYLPHGYFFYVAGCLPEGKDPREVDKKLIAKYEVGVSRTTRSRRKLAGRANLHYLRFERNFLLLATHGEHRFFAEEAGAIRDVRRTPIQFAGYAVAVKRGQYLRRESPEAPVQDDGRYRVRVRIGRARFSELKAYFADRAAHDSVERISAELWSLPFEPYAPVRRQLLMLVSVVNRRRKAAGLDQAPCSAVRLRRRIVKPFERRRIQATSDVLIRSIR